MVLQSHVFKVSEESSLQALFVSSAFSRRNTASCGSWQGTFPFRCRLVIIWSYAFSAFLSFALLYRLEFCGSPNFFPGSPRLSVHIFLSAQNPYHKKENKVFVQNYRFHLLHLHIRKALEGRCGRSSQGLGGHVHTFCMMDLPKSRQVITDIAVFFMR